MNEPKGNTQAEIEALLARLESHAARLGKNNSAAASTINVNAGGVGVWIAAMACVVTLVAVMIACFFISQSIGGINGQIKELRDKDETLQAYITVGYGQPKEKEENE